MSQKANTITLRQNSPFLNLSNLNKKFFLLGLNFLKNFKQLLLKKNIFLINEVLNINNNKIFLNCFLLFKTTKIKIYKRRRELINSFQKNNFKLVNSKRNLLISTLFDSLIQQLKSNYLCLNFIVLNKYINQELVKFLFKKLKLYNSSIFDRKRSLFLDFLKITSLYVYKYADIVTFCTLLADIFFFLRKNKHSKYLSFLKHLFFILCVDLKKNFPDISTFNGMKFLIKGRLKGKPKASSFLTQIGFIPTQSISKNIEYAKARVYTQRYGVFGFKIWIFNE